MMQERVMACLERPALLYPDKPAMIDATETFTYAQFLARAKKLANGLTELGVKQGEAVAMLNLNHHRYLTSYFGCHAAGIIVVPLNIRLAAREIIYILKDSKSRVLFIDKPFLPMLDAIRKALPDLQIFYSDEEAAPEGLRHWDELLEGQPTHFDQPDVYEDDVAGYFYTGGTTGDPKGVMLTGRNVVSNAFHLQTMMRFTPQDRWLHIAPMFHLADVAAIYAISMMGATHVFGRAFEPKLTLELIQKHKVTVTILVPTMVNMVLNYEKFDEYDLSSLRNFLYGASPMPVPTLKKAMQKIPGPPMQGYGMTEAAPLVTVLSAEDHQRAVADPQWEWLLSTAGQVVPGVELKIVDDDDNEVGIGEAGEIALRGPNVMKGYLNKKEATDEVLYNGWYHSGDVAIRNEFGYVTIVDRKKDMIISGGENIYTTEVENVLMQHDCVLETTVVGVPSEEWGETVHAFVVLKPGSDATETEIVEFTRERLAHFKCPRGVEFIDELPKSGAGKILKRELRKKFWGEGRQVN